MAKIPTADSLGFRGPTATGGVTQSPRLELYQPKQAQIAVKALKEEAKKVDNDQLAQAQVQFKIAQMKEIEDFKNDSEIDTSAETYAGKIDEQVGKAAMNISSPQVREMFLQDARVSAEESKYKVQDAQFAKIKDRERALYATSMQTVIEGAKDLDYGNPAEAAVVLEMKTAAMIDQGYMTNQEAAVAVRKGMDEMALGRLKAMPPEQQLNMINSMDKDDAWVKRVPADVRKGLKDAAEIELAETMAMDYAFQLAQSDKPPDLGQADQLIYNEFKDAPYYLRDKLIKNARLEYGNLTTNKKLADTAQKVDTYNNIDLAVRDPGRGITLKDLNNKEGPYWEQWSKMDPAMRSNLENYMSAKSTGRATKTDRDVYMNLRSKFEAGPDARADAIDYFLKNNSALSDTDFKFWDKELMKGQPTGLFNHQTRLLAMTEKWNWKDQSKLLDGLDRWYTGFQQTHQGAPPTDQQVAEQIRKSVEEQASSSGFMGYFTGEKYPYSKSTDELVSTFELKLQDKDPNAVQQFMGSFDPEQQNEIRYNYMRKRDGALLQDVITNRKESGLPVDMAAIQREFTLLYGARNK